MRSSARLIVHREPGLPVRALTCPTPNHYSIIYYRSSLWESKHRSHVTLCDYSSEGGEWRLLIFVFASSLSSSPIPLFCLLFRSDLLLLLVHQLFSFSFAFRHSRTMPGTRVRWPRFSCQTDAETRRLSSFSRIAHGK